MSTRARAAVAAVALLCALAAIPGGASGANPADYGFDARLDSGTTYWTGQELYVDATAVVEDATGGDVGDATAGERTFELRRVDDDGRPGLLARQFVVDRSGGFVLDTTGATSDRYVIVYGGDVVEVTDGDGRLRPSSSADATAAAQFELARQRLAAYFDREYAFHNSERTLTVTSNRASTRLEVRARGVDADALADSFGDRVVAVDEANDSVFLDATGDDEFTVTFDDDRYEYGRWYDFVLDAVDADARAEASIHLGRITTTTATTTTTRTTAPPPTSTTATTTTAPPTTTTTAPPTATTAPTTAPPTTTTTPSTATTTATDGQAGLTVGVGLVALAAAAALARRR